MIVVRSPFRLSFVGGGSDIRSFYENNRGAVISTSVNKYMYLSLHRKFDQGFRIAYSKIEEVKKKDDIMHPIVRNVLEHFDVNADLEITSTADIPGKGTGLGSSSSYCISLIRALSEYFNYDLSKKEIAELACHVEIEMCQEPIGKQDQYACALGGYNKLEFFKSGQVKINPITISEDYRSIFEAHWMVFYTGKTRSASKILKVQAQMIKKPEKINMLVKMVELVDPFVDSLLSEDIEYSAELLNLNWRLKKELTADVSNTIIDQMYDTAIDAGALAGKLLGAGAGGFLFLLVPPHKKLNVKYAMRHLKHVSFESDNTGTSVVYKGV